MSRYWQERQPARQVHEHGLGASLGEVSDIRPVPNDTRRAFAVSSRWARTKSRRVIQSAWKSVTELRMPSYRGNIGNLCADWVLCELVDCCSGHWTQLRFVDAYSMARGDRAAEITLQRPVRPCQSSATRDSIYERTWSALDGSALGYPNSAAFLAALWRGEYSMILCEYDDATVGELRSWKAIGRGNRGVAESRSLQETGGRGSRRRYPTRIRYSCHSTRTCSAAAMPLTMAAR